MRACVDFGEAQRFDVTLFFQRRIGWMDRRLQRCNTRQESLALLLQLALPRFRLILRCEVSTMRLIERSQASMGNVSDNLFTGDRITLLSTFVSHRIVTAFTGIIADLKNLIISITAVSGFTFNDVDAGPLVDALVLFVKVHRALLFVIIGKYSIFSKFALTAPIAAVLRLLEAGVDAFAFALIGLIPTCSNSCKQPQLDLDASLSLTIKTYSCIPIPFFHPCS
ncbi:hypothetical protein FB451DRAFT_1396916 [Mycena latifolia]|nr:hypothetical protein FB451DRAFT_1396916 [Mycena latifolia]